MIGNVVLQTKNIVKSFPGTKALSGVSVELAAGEVHALVGENGAGKSTLMNIISGVFPFDEGKIILDGEEVHFNNPSDAQKAGISLVHQELALCSHVTVAENIFIGRLPQKAGLIDKAKLAAMAEEKLRLFDANINPNQIVAELSVAQQQIVEIAKALALDCKVVIFDEPTSSLNEHEAQKLFKIIADITAKGIGVFYISHKLSEIFQICDRITILRDGRYIKTVDAKTSTSDDVVTEMVGRRLSSLFPAKSTTPPGPEILRVDGLAVGSLIHDVSFTVRKGEILGLCGLVGVGRTEVARAVCGIDEKEAGQVLLEGREIRIDNYKHALANGMCYLSEDRKLDGLFLEMNIKENLISPQVDKVAHYGVLFDRPLERMAGSYKEKLNIKYSHVRQKVGRLSGGNQQKVMIAKLLAIGPRLIFLDEPTRGVDVGAKSEIYNTLRTLCEEGLGLVVISSEMSEVEGLCDRVVVMNLGTVAGELTGRDVTQDNIIGMISQSNEAQRVKTL